MHKYLVCSCSSTSKRAGIHSEVVSKRRQTFVTTCSQPCRIDESLVDGKVFDVFRIEAPKGPQQVIADAVRVGHPLHFVTTVNSDMESAIECMLQDSDKARRSAFLKKWVKRTVELREQEKNLPENLAEHMRRILQGKKCS